MTILPTTSPETWGLSDIFCDRAKDPNCTDIITNALQLALSIAGAMAMIFLIVGAFYYFTAFGNEERAANGKKIITWAIVGVVIIVLSKVIIAEIWHLLTNTPLTFPI